MSQSHPLTQALLAVQGAIDDVETFTHRVVPAWREKLDKVKIVTLSQIHDKVKSKLARAAHTVRESVHQHSRGNSNQTNELGTVD